MLINRKRRVILAGAVLVVLVLAFSFAGPGRTEGTVAAAVQVMNAYVSAEGENNSRTRFEYLVKLDPSTDIVYYTSLPAGKRLVIDFVSGQCYGGSVPVIYVGTGPIFSLTHFFIPVSTGPVGGTPFYVLSQSTHLYVEPGEGFAVFMPDSTSVSCDISVTGFLVNA